MSNKKFFFILAAIALIFLYKLATNPSGVKVSESFRSSQDPVQEEVSSAQDSAFQIEASSYRWTVTPKAQYRIAARVLSAERYHTGWQSTLSPVDLALGWGDLNSQKVDQWISWRQDERWYFYNWTGGSPYQEEYIVSHSANTHIIPATKNVEEAALRVDRNDQILLEGLLVDVDGGKTNETYWWHSSLSRDDTGDGSCELLYLKRLVTGGKEYR